MWLEYEPRSSGVNCVKSLYLSLKGFTKEHPIVANALTELERGFAGMLAVTKENIIYPLDEAKPPAETLALRLERDTEISAEGYQLTADEYSLSLRAADESGLLYGVFHILRQIAIEKPLAELTLMSQPDIKLRMLNHWDNLDGSIERGYSGRSFFFAQNKVLPYERMTDYARFAASVGINAVAINNVNVKDAATRLITPEYYSEVRQIAAIFAAYGIRLFLSLNFAASLELGGPQSADPFAEEVINWWQKQIAETYAAIPDLGGFLIKADSEGRPGPFTYGRTQADGANMLAKIVAPYGGLIIWRCFVYNCTQDWRDYQTDRARAGYDNFITTDGDYLDNVFLQIKNGPMDFQIREPISPLLGAMEKTNQILEVQIAQEYTGHQIDVCYLVPMWKEALDFVIGAGNDKVSDVVSGKTYANRGGIAAVANTGDDANWTGNDLAAANFYGFGRLSWSVNLTAADIVGEWIMMTLSRDEQVINAVSDILLHSRLTYEKYTTPLGIGWMVSPHSHYGPSVDGYEYSRWGTYHRADYLAIGVDRTSKGTGFSTQYREPHASIYENPATCPEDLLLFFHRLPYSYLMKNGKTLLQHFYDCHHEGVKEVEAMIAGWNGLAGQIDPAIHTRVAERFARQLDNAIEWRDQVNTYFYRKSGIEDRYGK